MSSTVVLLFHDPSHESDARQVEQGLLEHAGVTQIQRRTMGLPDTVLDEMETSQFVVVLLSPETPTATLSRMVDVFDRESIGFAVLYSHLPDYERIASEVPLRNPPFAAKDMGTYRLLEEIISEFRRG